MGAHKSHPVVIFRGWMLYFLFIALLFASRVRCVSSYCRTLQSVPPLRNFVYALYAMVAVSPWLVDPGDWWPPQFNPEAWAIGTRPRIVDDNGSP